MELQHLTRLGKRIGLSVIFLSLIPASIVKAQIVPDGTLESTVETIQELMKIDGGLQQGSNLFHSFEEFNIPEGMEASFENAVEIENIFTRVTGDSASTINGTLSAQGGANLFLMNPHGIVFGQNASINIGGSFIATTADNIQFADSTEFAATPTEDPTPLLTNEIPIGLGFGSDDGTDGAITVNGSGNEITSESPVAPAELNPEATGITVPAGETFALVGSGINFDGGVINAPDAQVYLNSVESGTVDITQAETGIALSNSNVNSFQDITLDNQSLVNVSGEQTGTASLVGSDINILGQTYVISRNEGSSVGNPLTIEASDTFRVAGQNPETDVRSNVRVEATGSGDAGNLDVSANEVLLEDGARIRGNSFGTGSSGKITFEASDSIILLEPSSIISTAFAEGNSGGIEIVTPELKLDVAGISASTFGTGEAGLVKVDAELVEIANSTPDNRGAIASSAFGEGDALGVEINTQELKVLEGGSLSSSSFGSGNAGDVTVNASDSIEVSGNNPNNMNPGSSTESTIRTAVQVDTPDESSGNSGNLTLNTPELNVTEQASINVENEGLGSAGTLRVNAEDINLDESASITATSVSGSGGDIELNTNGLQMDNESQITAAAENEAGGGNININATNITAKKDSAISANASGGDGGNINIDTETLLGLQNSDITANAIEGDGGNINITATSILGFEERPELTPLSDITASSEFGVDGNININSPETNAEEDVQVSAKKPEAPLTPLEFVKGCQLPEGILTTRGRGVPESPYPFPFGRFSYDEDVYKKAEETMRQERLRRERSSRQNGISKREAEEQRQERELAMLREKQRNLPNRHAHLMYEVTDDREVGPMLLPAPKGKLVEPADGRTDKNAIPAFYSQSNELPPISREKRLRQEGNVLVINPDGSKHFVRMFLMSHPTEEMCQNTVGRN